MDVVTEIVKYLKAKEINFALLRPCVHIHINDIFDIFIDEDGTLGIKSNGVNGVCWFHGNDKFNIIGVMNELALIIAKAKRSKLDL